MRAAIQQTLECYGICTEAVTYCTDMGGPTWRARICKAC